MPAGLDYLRPEYDRLQQVDTVQCIWRQAAPHSRDFDDTKLQNWQLGCAMRSMYEQQLFTDATLVVEGKRLHAHRAVLAAASPVFLRMFSSQMQEGESRSQNLQSSSSCTQHVLMVSFSSQVREGESWSQSMCSVYMWLTTMRTWLPRL